MNFKTRYYLITRWTVFNLWWLKVCCRIHYKIEGLETGALINTAERGGDSLHWLATASSDEVASLLATLATRDFVSDDTPRDAGLARIFHELTLRIRSQSSPGDRDRLPATELAALMKLPELKKQVKALQRTVDGLEDHSTDVGRQEAA